jgi:subtilisin family serine protease
MSIEGRWTRWVVGLTVAAVLGGAAQAGPGGKKGKTRTSAEDGGIDPSNIAVVDDDLLVASVEDESGPCLDYDAVDFQLGAPEAHEVATGRGVVVAVLDGGFNLHHPALDGHLAGWGFDAIDLDGDPHDTGNGIDDDRDGVVDAAVGHGTFIAGMVLKAAPDALVLPIRIRDDEGFGSNEELIRGLRYAMDMGADVVNLSVEKGKAKQKGVWNTIEEARQRGIVIVCSAGNDGWNDTNNLIEHDDVLMVGAVDGSDRITDFSNYEDGATRYLMVFAPGLDLFGPVGAPSDGAMGWWSGTSFSAGLLSGASALILERNPWYGPREVRDVVETSTEPVRFADGTPYAWGGRINLARAVLR